MLLAYVSFAISYIAVPVITSYQNFGLVQVIGPGIVGLSSHHMMSCLVKGHILAAPTARNLCAMAVAHELHAIRLILSTIWLGCFSVRSAHIIVLHMYRIVLQVLISLAFL
jgi:hypothetical protein